ncbi:ATP-grasp domain-containing protein [Neisseria meningitidis]|uniref:ATP-grasp domain-containing protein n=1 Tax=Neisseria meningitidis TaxID=487 RepID=UPI0002A5194C|nr:ATP-grasp domain-containing protein [Neisseria meningitidis]EOC39326.1 ATP-grasp domain protein [Neisseria meningitidis 2005079]AIZ19869.1 carbamoyl phosphate synthase large subunit [Neisseria meningitidis M7124]ANX14687.1 carbamoyl phosphate synthase large subunit [Neisseria meningitidis]ANX20355.1 carbamoyl phosphate synthase large subunit [Neisseria meningitidis]ANX28369.1 carbamoyl phosphate synthase large subunit [Neisseria meningitidis]
MKKNNILILSAGRRVELVQDFQTEAARFSDGIGVFATDLNPHMSSACHVADRAFSVPRIDAAEYIDSILELAQQHDIGLIVPTIDTELLKLAEARDRFEAEGIHIVISDAKLITLCCDKRLTAGLFAQYSIRSPEIYERDRLVFPCFAKPYDGSRAIGAKKINTPADLTVDITEDPKMMFAQYIDIENTFSEFTVDMYYDRQGRLKCAIPRKRLEVRSGEISKGVTCKNSLYQTLLEKMSVLQGARGCITAQFFYNEETGEFYGVEINPRFGGGFPLTYAAGGNYPSRLMREYLGDEEIPFSDDWENNLIMLRYDAKVLVHEND